MPQVISCPRCSQKMQVPDGSAGKQAKCPTCKTVFVIGGARQPVGAAVAAAPTPAALPSTRPVPAPPPKPSAPAPAPAPPSTAAPAGMKYCPACKSEVAESAVACLDCGYLFQTDAAAAESDEPPNLCSNPACGVANPPGERVCQRCGNPLPTAPGTVLHNRYRVE